MVHSLARAMNNPQPGDEHISSFDAVDANWFIFDVPLKLALKSLCMTLYRVWQMFASLRDKKSGA